MQTLKPRVALLQSNIKSAVRSVRITGNSLQKIRREFFARNPLCCMCTAEGRTGLATELDHITPLWKGGAEAASNRQGLCHEHHQVKTAEEAAERARGGGV